MEKVKLVEEVGDDEELTLPTSIVTTVQSKTPLSPPNVSCYQFDDGISIA